MNENKEYLQILKERGIITGVMFYENREMLDLVSKLAEDSELWQSLKMFLEAPILIDEDEDNANTPTSGFVNKEHRMKIKNALRVEDIHLFNAYQTNKMRKNFIANIFMVLSTQILSPVDEKRFEELRFQFSGSHDPKCFLPKVYEYEMSNSRKRGFMASMIALIEHVAQSHKSLTSRK